MVGLEMIALALGVFNGALLAIRPLARFHSRLDVLEARLHQIETTLSRLEARLYNDLRE